MQGKKPYHVLEVFNFLRPRFIFPNWFEERLKNSYLGAGIKEYVRETYHNSPEEFIRQLKRADSNSKRPGIGNENRNMWIAANETSTRSPKYEQSFCCYYCSLPLQILPTEDVHFEHFNPKVQEPGNIVPACKWCDKFKQGRTPDDFRNMMLNPDLIQADSFTTNIEKLKLKHFIPLVVNHAPWDKATDIHHGERCIDEMIKIAKDDFKVDITEGSPIKWQARWNYYELYRSKWLPPEIYKLGLQYEQRYNNSK